MTLAEYRSHIANQLLNKHGIDHKRATAMLDEEVTREQNVATYLWSRHVTATSAASRLSAWEHERKTPPAGRLADAVRALAGSSRCPCA